MSIAGRRPAGELEGLLEAVLRRIDRGELVRLARELVRIPSVYRPGDPASGEGGVAAFLAGYLEEAGFEVRAEEVSPGRPNVWAVWEGPLPGPTLLFEAHTDVVTEGRAEDWEHPPFGAEVEDGRLYGRGACDTKGNLAAAVVAVRAIRDAGIPFPGRLVLCHPVDEEGMMSGIKAFIRRGHAEGVDAARAVAALRAAVPGDAVVANDAGNFSLFLHRHWSYDHPRTQLAPANGAMGYGVPAAVAAKLADPGRCVVAVCGDGGFLMSGQELETAVRYGLPVLVVVLRNGLHGTIAMHQLRSLGRMAGVEIGGVDLAAYARSLGARGYTVGEEGELEPVLREALASGEAALVDVMTDPEIITPESRLQDLRRA